MTGPTLTAFLCRLNHALAGLAPDQREPVEECIGLLVRACENAVQSREFWEQAALRHQREIASLYAQVEVLRGKTKSLEACIRDMNEAMRNHEMVSRTMRRFLVSRERARLIETVYRRGAN